MTKHRFLVARRIGDGPFSHTRTCLNTGRVDRLRTTALDDVTDLDAAYELTRLALTDLEAFGTSGGASLDDDEIAVLLRSLRAVLKRLNVTFEPPFRDFKTLKRCWIDQGMTNNWEARRSYIHNLFDPILAQLDDYHPHLRKNRDKTRRITDVTRRRLRDGLTITKTWWSGTLNEVEFLNRLYDLDNLPSDDPRFATAGHDIWQHCINNPDDWDGDWIWHDERFGLADGDEALLRFLAEMLHPAVRTDPAEVEQLHTFLNETLVHDGYELTPVDRISGAPVFAARTIGGGVPGAMKNLIFAADGPKPEIVLKDAINNDVLIVKNEQYCLVYDQPLNPAGLTWGDLIAWWRARQSLPETMPDSEVGRTIYKRLWASLYTDPEHTGSLTPEQKVFRTYCELYPINDGGADHPALLPQVYLHYDPKTRKERGGKDSLVLGRERMDFLLLLSRGIRIVVEVDGQHHYAEGNAASPRRYSKMVAEDRALRLKGYEVYRFGGYELIQDNAPTMLRQFFVELLGRQR